MVLFAGVLDCIPWQRVEEDAKGSNPTHTQSKEKKVK
jgi:hypothetical protein